MSLFKRHVLIELAVANQTKDLERFRVMAPHTHLEKGTYNGRSLQSYADVYQDFSGPVFTTGKDKQRFALRTKFFKVYRAYQRAYNNKGWAYPYQAKEFSAT
jgi:hypothetical protein